jgi:hypothetical protein
MFRPPSLLAPQIVPTAALLPQGSRGFYVRAYRALLPPHAPDMLTVRRQVIDGTGTCTLLDSQPCRLLQCHNISTMPRFPDCTQIPLRLPRQIVVPAEIDLGVRWAAAVLKRCRTRRPLTPVLPPNSSAVLSVPVAVVAVLARSPDRRSTRHGPALALSRHSCDLEASITWSLAKRAAQDRRRYPPADPRDGPREFPLECTTHPRRTAEAQHHHLAGHCITLHAGVERRPIGDRNGGHFSGTTLPRLFAVGP